MHITEPAQFQQKHRPKRHKRLVAWLLVFILVSGVVYGALLYFRPLPPVNAQKAVIPLPAAQNVNLTWPAYGQAAIGAEGFGLLANHGPQTPAPMASTAKLITTLAVLRQKPITSGQTGPTITLDSTDVGLYQDYYSRGGSVAAVQDGEKITEYQAIQAMLLPSANNMADSLARWAFGSVDNYLTYANQMAASLGLNNTHITDASGFSPDTRSTATDMVTIALEALKQPVIMQIAGQKQASIPVEGTIQNTNWLLAQDGVIGIKTGDTDAAGGCFVLAATYNVAPSHTVKIVSAILGAPTLTSAISDSLQLLKSSYSGFSSSVIMKKNQPVATYETAWGSNATAVLAKDVTAVSWIGRPLSAKTVLPDITAPAKKSQQTAEVKVDVNGTTMTIPAILNQAINSPSLKWRLSRQAY